MKDSWPEVKLTRWLNKDYPISQEDYKKYVLGNFEDTRPTYDFLYEFYLKSQCSGTLGDFNKKYFPNDYETMSKELREINEASK